MTRAALIGVVAVLTMTSATLADTIVRADGRTFEGAIIAEDAAGVTLEMDSGGITLRQRIARSHIKAIRRDQQQGPKYCPIPLVGDFGGTITARAFKQALAEARRARADYILLQIDSPGGSVPEMVQIIDQIAAARDLKFIAHVKSALSAAAVVAMACPRIYMEPGSSIGAAVAYRMGDDRLPKLIEEKFNSGFRAKVRAAAELGGHDVIFIRGMTEGDLRLLEGDKDGRLTLVEAPPDASAFVKQKGQILTLTAAEAQKYGLSAGTVQEVDEIAAALHLPSWKSTNDHAARIMTAKAAAQQRKAEDSRRSDEQYRGKLEQVLPAARQIDAEAARVLQRARDARAEIDRLKAEYARQADALEIQRQADRAAAANQRGAVGKAMQIESAHRAAAAALHDRYDDLLSEQGKILEQAAADMKKLVDRRREVLSQLSPE